MTLDVISINLSTARWAIAVIALLLALGTAAEIYLFVRGVPEVKRIWRSLRQK
jgi:hypothetical protein